MSEQMNLGGPYLTIAVLCEKVLQEKDGVPSIIRVVDRITISGHSPSMPPTQISPTLVVAMKAGMFRGVADLEIQPFLPSGTRGPSLRVPLEFQGDDERGPFAVLQLGFLVTEPGLYWFEIKLSGMLMTRVPMRVVYLPRPSIVDGESLSGPRS